jgi:hypothetical protein
MAEGESPDADRVQQALEEALQAEAELLPPVDQGPAESQEAFEIVGPDLPPCVLVEIAVAKASVKAALSQNDAALLATPRAMAAKRGERALSQPLSASLSLSHELSLYLYQAQRECV